MQTIPAPDKLMMLYYKLAGQIEVENVQEYADQYRLLAAEFAAYDRPSMAEMCAARYRQYTQLAEYMPDMKRVQNDGYVLLERLGEHKTDEEQPAYDWQTRKDME